jgi:hypothetical protein
MRAGCGIFALATRRAHVLFQFYNIAATDAPRLNHSAQQTAPPANRFLKSAADFVHLVAGLARLRHFEQRLAGA